MKSNFLNLNTKDFLKGLIIAILSGIGTALTPDATVKTICFGALIGFISYLIKNLFTNSKDEILKTENNGK